MQINLRDMTTFNRVNDPKALRSTCSTVKLNAKVTRFIRRNARRLNITPTQYLVRVIEMGWHLPAE